MDIGDGQAFICTITSTERPWYRFLDLIFELCILCTPFGGDTGTETTARGRSRHGCARNPCMDRSASLVQGHVWILFPQTPKTGPV